MFYIESFTPSLMTMTEFLKQCSYFVFIHLIISHFFDCCVVRAKGGTRPRCRHKATFSPVGEKHAKISTVQCRIYFQWAWCLSYPSHSCWWSGPSLRQSKPFKPELGGERTISDHNLVNAVQIKQKSFSNVIYGIYFYYVRKSWNRISKKYIWFLQYLYFLSYYKEVKCTV